MDIDILDDSEDIKVICEQYWELNDDGEFVHTLTSIASTFNTTTADIHKVAKNNSIAYSDTIKCIDCEQSYVYENRRDLQASKNTLEYCCDDCENERIKLELQEKRSLLTNSCDQRQKNSYTINDLSVRHAVLLLALIRYCGSEDLAYLNEFEANNTDVFSPDNDFSIQILRELYGKGYLAINPISDLDYIELTEEGSFSFYLKKVKWILPIDEVYKHPRHFVEALEKEITSMAYIENSSDEVIKLCKEVSLMECLSYLDHVLEDHQLSFKAGEKTILMFSKALENFTVAQIYSFIWRAGKDAAAFYMRSNVAKKHAANTIVSNIEKQMERALANNWEVASYRRNYNVPQSVVSRVLFNLLLHTDDGGFNQLLHKLV